MLCVKTKTGLSPIHGIGLFADEPIPKGTVIWKFLPGFDLALTPEQILSFPKLVQIYLYKYTYKDMRTKEYYFCSDDAKYFNHSEDPNTSDGETKDSEGFTIAARDIAIGEELTADYGSFELHPDPGNVFNEIAKKYQLVDELDPRLKNKNQSA